MSQDDKAKAIGARVGGLIRRYRPTAVYLGWSQMADLCHFLEMQGLPGPPTRSHIGITIEDVPVYQVDEQYHIGIGTSYE